MNTRTKYKAVFLIVLVALGMLSAMPAFAQDAEPTETPTATATVEPVGDVAVPVDEPGDPVIPSDILGFVTFLALNSVTIIVMLEKLKPYQALPGEVKTGITFFLVVIAIPIGSDLLTSWIQSLPPETLATINHYFSLAVGGLYTFSTISVLLPGVRGIVAWATTARAKAVKTTV